MPISIKTVFFAGFFLQKQRFANNSRRNFAQFLYKLLKVFKGFVKNFAKFEKKYKKIYKNPLTNNSFGHNM